LKWDNNLILRNIKMIKIANNLEKLAKTKEEKKREVDYGGRAAKGFLYGGIPGGLIGALAGGAVGADKGNIPLGALLGLGVGGVLGGSAGALGNVIAGYTNEDIITRSDEPNRLRRALLGGIGGGLYGTSLGIQAGTALGEPAGGAALGALGGTAAGALGAGVIWPWLNSDMFGQEENKD
jgi:hypothetical protein